MSVAHREVDNVLQNSKKWKESFHKPLPLGVKKRLAIITCMDSRVHPERIFGLDIGDAEVIRNAGGRVTVDVIRSWIVCQDLLNCNAIMVIHHTDCGGQAAARRHDELVKKIHDHGAHAPYLGVRLASKIVRAASYFIPKPLRRKAAESVIKPIHDLRQSVVDDVNALRRSTFVNKDVAIYGYVYSTEDGSLDLVTKHDESLGAGAHAQ